MTSFSQVIHSKAFITDNYPAHALNNSTLLLKKSNFTPFASLNLEPLSEGNQTQSIRAVRFRPCIDIHQGKVKQIVGSTLRDLSKQENSNSIHQNQQDSDLITNFVSEKSSAEYAQLYRDDDVAGGHVIMLGADPASQSSAMEALKAFPGGFHIGGGINSENAKMYLDAGASHVIVTSYVFRDGKVDRERLKSLLIAVGKKQIVLDLSCRKKDGKYFVVTDRWQKFSDLIVNEENLNELSQSCDEFLVHGVDVEGMKLGIDEELVSLLGKFSPIPVTYAGGVQSMDDLEKVKLAGNNSVDITVGSALDIFGGNLPYTQVVEWHKSQQKSLTL